MVGSATLPLLLEVSPCHPILFDRQSSLPAFRPPAPPVCVVLSIAPMPWLWSDLKRLSKSLCKGWKRELNVTLIAASNWLKTCVPTFWPRMLWSSLGWSCKGGLLLSTIQVCQMILYDLHLTSAALFFEVCAGLHFHCKMQNQWHSVPCPLSHVGHVCLV